MLYVLGLSVLQSFNVFSAYTAVGLALNIRTFMPFFEVTLRFYYGVFRQFLEPNGRLYCKCVRAV